MLWNLWQKAKTYGKLPSEVFGEEDSIAAWMLDSAVTWFGIEIENLLQERDKVKMGNEVEYRPRYTLSRLLDQDFKLIRQQEPSPQKQENPGPGASGMSIWQPLLSWAGNNKRAIKFWKYVPPEEQKPN